MTNREKLMQLVMDVFLLTEEEFSYSLKREEVSNWDSLGIVSIAVGIQEIFGYHLPPTEAMAIGGVEDIINVLEKHGISFDE